MQMPENPLKSVIGSSETPGHLDLTRGYSPALKMWRDISIAHAGNPTTGIVTSITAVAENRSSVPVGNSQNSHHRPENSPKTQRSCPKIQPPTPHQFSHSLDRNSSHAECQRWISTIQSLEIARSKLKPEQNSLNNYHWIGLRDFKGPIYSKALYISW